jgi:hypothetical protein
MAAVPRETREEVARGLAWHALPVEAVLQALRSSASAGSSTCRPHGASRLWANVPPQAGRLRPEVFWRNFARFRLHPSRRGGGFAVLGDTFEAGAVGAIVLLNASSGRRSSSQGAGGAAFACRAGMPPSAMAAHSWPSATLPGDLNRGGDVALMRACSAIALGQTLYNESLQSIIGGASFRECRSRNHQWSIRPRSARPARLVCIAVEPVARRRWAHCGMIAADRPADAAAGPPCPGRPFLVFSARPVRSSLPSACCVASRPMRCS